MGSPLEGDAERGLYDDATGNDPSAPCGGARRGRDAAVRRKRTRTVGGKIRERKEEENEAGGREGAG